MHLEDVTVEGFKSFSQETPMNFQPGISVIIGNNGVGKSNILDAIVWAMGDSHLENVRCYQPDELFFTGSKESELCLATEVQCFSNEDEVLCFSGKI